MLSKQTYLIRQAIYKKETTDNLLFKHTENALLWYESYMQGLKLRGGKYSYLLS